MKNQIEEILIKISQEIIGGANEWCKIRYIAYCFIKKHLYFVVFY